MILRRLFGCAAFDQRGSAVSGRIGTAPRPDIALMSPPFMTGIVGRDAVLAHLRAMMCGAQIHEYNTTDLKGHSSGSVGIITYRWQLDWTVDHKRRPLSGHDILVLRQSTRVGSSCGVNSFVPERSGVVIDRLT